MPGIVDKSHNVLRIARAVFFALMTVSMTAPWGRLACGSGPPTPGIGGLIFLIWATAGVAALPLGAFFLCWALVIIRPGFRIASWIYRVLLWILCVLLIWLYLQGEPSSQPLSRTWGASLFWIVIIAAGAVEMISLFVRKKGCGRGE